AIKILKKLGYEVVAITGKVEDDYLIKIGAKRVLNRDEFNDTSRPMLRGVYAGAIDTVGGNILSTVIKSLKYNGVVTACGNAAGISFETSVFPFILRGVTLYGVDSVEISRAERDLLWNKLATEWRIDNLDEIVNEIGLDGLSEKIDNILSGKNVGRVLVKL
ncbi:MAG: zinc-binding dehydrogenase, partial [Cetobacterium sp.]